MFHRIQNIYKTGFVFFLLLLAGIGYAQTPVAGHILIVNSYDTEIKWSTEVADSIQRELQRFSPQLIVRQLHLNYNSRKTAAEGAAEILRQRKPDVAILIGDEAEAAFLATPGWAGVKSLVVTTTREARLSGSTGKGGAGFSVSMRENLTLIQTMVPSLTEILFIDRRYPTTESYVKLLETELATQRLTQVKLNTIYLDSTNLDQIYQTILENKPGRAILTATWNFFDKNSAFTRGEVDEMFSTRLVTPVFSIFPNYYNNDFLLGGYNLSLKVCADKISEQTKKLLQGSEVMFELVKNGNIVLNKAALTRLGLTNNTKGYFEIRYVNGEGSLFETYRYEFIGCGILLVIVILLGITLYRRIKETKGNRKALKELKEQSAFFNKVYDNINLNFAIYNNNGERVMEVLATDAPRQEVADFLPKELFRAEFLQKEDIGIIKGKKNLHKEYNSTLLSQYAHILPEEGRVILFIAKPMQSLENDTYKYIAIAVDITDTQQDILAKEALNRLIKEIANVSSIGVACYDLTTGKGFASPNWFMNLGEANTGTLIQPDYSNCTTEDKAKIIDFKQELANGKSSRLEMDMKVYNPQTGKEHWIRQNIFMHEYDPKNNRMEVIDLTFDITKDKLQEINSFNLNMKAESDNKDGDRFISGISHEIRTPLNSIIGFSNMLTTLTSPGDRAEIITIIKRNNVILIELINNILSIAKMDAGTYTFEKNHIALNEFFLELKIATAHMVAGEGSVRKDINIICDIPELDYSIISDAWNFRQVMINLLSNAVKFTEKGTIMFGYHPREEGVYFYVKDTGCGIALEHQERIFNRFERLDQTSGSGLGLSLCKSIVHHLDGEIGVISKEDEGSTFWFILKYESAR